MTLDEPWAAWAAARPTPRLLHLDSGAAGRSTAVVLDAVAAHARAEATDGAYVAAERAAEQIAGLRRGLATLTGIDTDGIALVESAGAALAVALQVAPIVPGDEVAVLPGEWGPNLRRFAGAGMARRLLDVDADGVVDLDALERSIADRPPAFVHLVQQAAHRARRQPVAAAVDICRRHGVPVWADAAQAIGHCDVAAGADVVYGTSRKWLTGPRGVGVLAVAPGYRSRLRLERAPAARPGGGPLDGLESHEAHIAGRVGLGLAVADTLAIGVPVVAERLDAVGRMVRSGLAGVRGWRVVDPAEAPGAITAIEPTAGQDVAAVRARLLAEHGILTTASDTARAPLERTVPWLRVSPHVDATAADVERLAAALSAVSD